MNEMQIGKVGSPPPKKKKSIFTEHAHDTMRNRQMKFNSYGIMLG